MPKRTNLFQRVVTILHENIAGDATVEESAMLHDSDSGSDREVDVLITTKVAGTLVRVGVEATNMAPADVAWVDSMVGKHSSLPTDKLVLVSGEGFTPAARKKAESKAAVPLAPEDLTREEAAGEIVNKLGSVYVKAVSLSIVGSTVTVHPPDEPQQVSIDADPGTYFYFADGADAGTLADNVSERFHEGFAAISDQINLSDVTEKEERLFTLTTANIYGRRTEARLDAPEEPIFVKYDDDKSSVLWRLLGISVATKAIIDVGEVSLSHAKMAPLSDGFSFGEGSLGDDRVILVVDESTDAPKARTVVYTNDGRTLESEMSRSTESTDTSAEKHE